MLYELIPINTSLVNGSLSLGVDISRSLNNRTYTYTYDKAEL